MENKIRALHHELQDAAIYTEDYFFKKVSEIFESEFWIPFDWEDKSTHPPKYGKYLICRKDGKVHWETWNGSYWAYNGKVIVGWATIPLTTNLFE